MQERLVGVIRWQSARTISVSFLGAPVRVLMGFHSTVSALANCPSRSRFGAVVARDGVQSTFIEEFGSMLIAKGHRVAVLVSQCAEKPLYNYNACLLRAF